MSLVARSARRAVIAAVLIAAMLAQHPTPADAAARKRKHSTSTGSKYVVVLHDDANSDAVAQDHSRRYHARVTYVYRRALHGYAAASSWNGRPAAARSASAAGTSSGSAPDGWDAAIRAAASTVPMPSAHCSGSPLTR